MWGVLDKLTGQITKYSTFFGQLWYLIVFIFRLIVVATLGGSVYGDEQSAFRCSTQVIGCLNVCYNEFAKLSHLRFWAFQLLGITAPTVIFHFFSLYMTGQIQKIKSAEKELNAADDKDEALSASNDGYTSQAHQEALRHMQRRQKMVGKVRGKRVFDGSKVEEIPVTNKIHTAYYITTVVRMIVEGLFIAIGYDFYYLYNPVCDGSLIQSTEVCQPAYSPAHLVWQTVPAVFVCHSDLSPDVVAGCSQHFLLGGRSGYVPCWVSRPFEKTIFLRYMNFLSVICFFLCAAELVYIPLKFVISKAAKNNRIYKYNNRHDDYGMSPARNYHDIYYLENNPLQRPDNRISRISHRSGNVVPIPNNNKVQTFDNPKYEGDGV